MSCPDSFIALDLVLYDDGSNSFMSLSAPHEGQTRTSRSNHWTQSEPKLAISKNLDLPRWTTREPTSLIQMAAQGCGFAFGTDHSSSGRGWSMRVWVRSVERSRYGEPHFYRSRSQKAKATAEQFGDSPNCHYAASSRQPRRWVLCLAPVAPVGVLARTANEGSFPQRYVEIQ